jgi:crotonobetainyl-CoA:carnitine CoA-transferase CaiB-like acyl-CoA transferase
MTETPTGTQTGPLTGIRILDLSRILAGPVCTQLLGDYGADVIKIEKPGAGDDTRKWGPPFVQDADGNDTEESTFYLCANRNKRSVAVDISLADGQDIPGGRAGADSQTARQVRRADREFSSRRAG